MRARGRGGARALHAGVHVRLVVVTDVEHVVVSLEHPGQAREADVHGPAIAALRDDAHVLAAFDPQRRRDPRRYGGSIPEQRVDPRNPPGSLRIRSREHLEAAGGVGRDQLPVCRTHRGVQRVACTEGLAAALAGAVPARDRVRPLLAGLHRALLWVEQAIADRETARLIEADRRCLHARALLIPAPPPRSPHHAGCSPRAGRRSARRPSARARGSRHPSPCPGTSAARGDRPPRR